MRTAIIGLQYGDEGKGRVSGYLAPQYDWSVRFNGGPNAGHTVYDYNNICHKLHHLPAGAVLGKKVALDAGMFIDQHVISALGLYYCLIITSLLWGIGVLLLNRDNSYKKTKLWIIDPIASLIGILIGVINTGLFNLDEVFVGRLSMAFYQKMLGYVFVLLFGYVSVRLLLILNKEKADEIIVNI